MKSKLLTVILIFIISSLTAQSISEIKKNSTPIYGRMTGEYTPDREQFEKIKNILEEDVFTYFNLENQYNSELKKKVYKASEEFKKKSDLLKELKVELLKEDFYLDFQPSYYERNNLIEYDLDKNSFTVANKVSIYLLCEKENFIQFGRILVKPIPGLSINKNKYTAANGGVYVDQYISFIINNEKIALKIEENRSNLKLLFNFKFANIFPYPSSIVESSKLGLVTDLESVIAYNSKTNEIYHIYIKNE